MESNPDQDRFVYYPTQPVNAKSTARIEASPPSKGLLSTSAMLRSRARLAALSAHGGIVPANVERDSNAMKGNTTIPSHAFRIEALASMSAIAAQCRLAGSHRLILVEGVIVAT